eukprot:CAMPEP_0181243730 /NCGR_PEP_ID=MMETSP1096-20121128/42437_1 /TAXON_ID=156174 ORGANISM="Chrysochromulina ericina, Strain CCMP281" /NCGR_SAMPLE_ID=MMETSP1096 /ASSEMBLY_ACC=CAM_ASM_000453 /LENGTH=35 /DNA_ID= /DNA_START= /DNA_END= /DNA_ORIENTATION=
MNASESVAASVTSLFIACGGILTPMSDRVVPLRPA